MADLPNVMTELEGDKVVVYIHPEKRRGSAFSFSFPMDCTLDKEMAKGLDLIPALERLGVALAKQFNEKNAPKRTAEHLMGRKPDSKLVIGVQMLRVEFALIYAPGG